MIEFDETNLVSDQDYTFRLYATDKDGEMSSHLEILVLYNGPPDSTSNVFPLESQGQGYYGTNSLRFTDDNFELTLRSYTYGLTAEYWTNAEFSGPSAATEVVDLLWV